jgi:DNA-binding transcriptional LysR family regulator
MDLHRVEIFARVVEERGITAAAKSLRLPKSSVSRAVTLLEGEIGARLLRRSTRGIALTEAGNAFYAKAAQGLAALGEAREEVAALQAEICGRVRVTAPPDIGAWMLAPLVAQFTAEHPNVVVESELTNRVVDLAEERFDLAIRARDVDDESLVARRLPPLAFALYASRGYLDAHGTPRKPAELARHRCVLFRGTGGRAQWTLVGTKRSETVEVRGAVTADDFVYARESVAAGAGIGLLPEFVASAAGRTRLERVLPTYGSPGAPVFLVYPAGRYLPRRVAALRDALLAGFGGCAEHAASARDA